MSQIPFYTAYQAADWRAVMASNQHKTFAVMAIFIAIYVALGLLMDLYIGGGFAGEGARFFFTLRALIQFKIMPVIALVMGGVAFAALIIAYQFYDRLMLLGTEAREITPEHFESAQEKQLYHVMEELKIAAGLRYLPKIYLINAPYMNAFACGYSEKSALVAITSGLLERLTRSELQAVMAHELSHIRHGDIRLTLTASILSNLMLMLIDIMFYSMISGRSGDKRDRDNRFLIIIIILRYTLPLVTILLMLFLSRTREYMADAGSVELLRDNQPLGQALIKIAADYDAHSEAYTELYRNTKHEGVRRASYLYDPLSAGISVFQSFANAFSTHPSLKDRLSAIGFKSDVK